MEPKVYREKWINLKQGYCPQVAVSGLSRQIALSFIDRYYKSGSYESEYIDLLCEMATSSLNEELNNEAASALFEIIVETLCDDYQDMPTEIYSRVMSQVITCCRNTSQGKSLDKRLTGFGIVSFEDIYCRAMLIERRNYIYDAGRPPKKIILLSRVTVGADVAILSVMIQRLVKMFPHIEIVIIGSSKLSGIFAGNTQIRIRPLAYVRRGGLFERFSSWFGALDILAEEMPPGSENYTLLIDPDSRISQLGVLPLTNGDNYLLFNSRSCVSSLQNKSMAELTNQWMDKVFGIQDFCYPKVWLPSPTRCRAEEIANGLRAAGCKKLIAVNFGVGENPRKRLDIDFERKLLQEILNCPQTVVLLDKGFGEEEFSRSTSVILGLQNLGFKTASFCFSDSKYPKFAHGIINIQCDIGEIAALIARCDEFIGYDSACQHIAAAAETPTLTVFAGINNMNFITRWSACGNTKCRIVHIDMLSNHRHIDTDEVISRIIEEITSATRPTIKHPPKIQEIRTSGHGEKQAKTALES